MVKKDYLGKGNSFDLPEISPEHHSNIACTTNGNDFVLNYPNYSLVMNKETRQAFFSAANADFSKNNGSGRSYRIDRRIKESYQLDDIYYKNIDGIKNPYDKGHLTRRYAISWGDTQFEANRASKDSCYFTNISLQHENFNQDEWGSLEVAIENNNSDLDNRFNIMCGPIFSTIDRMIRPYPNMEPARVPSAFWKLISYIGKDSKKLEVNAFIVFQDSESILTMGQVKYNKNIKVFELYQSSTTLIEHLTGLEFPDVAFDNNPMFFFESDTTKNMNIITPQLHGVSKDKGKDCGICFSQKK